MATKPTWGSDAPFSLPEPMATWDTDKVDMEGFVFTADGIRVAASAADREDTILSGFRPEGRADGQG